MNTPKYFFHTLFVVVVSGLSFLAFKTFLPKKLFIESKIDSKNIVVDSLLLEALAEDEGKLVEDTLSKTIIDFKIANGIKFPPETFEEYKGNQYLVSFFEKLYQLETKKAGNVRIAYFGDSMTDGDLIVKDFRTYFQEKFGGIGVGFVNITSESATSRSTLVHEFSPNWKAHSYLKVKWPSHPFGVNGHVFFANDTINLTWVKFKASKSKFASDLPRPTLFYGHSANKEGKINYIIGSDTLSKKLIPNELVNKLVLSENNLKNIKVNFNKADSIPVYGFNFDDGRGVHVDNFSNRGNSGLPIKKLDVATMRAFHSILDYDLVVLHYGANLLNYGSVKFGWYEKKMEKVVAHLKECFPGASILIVSTADKSTKYDTSMKTDSAVVPLNIAQKRYAIKSESSFVNLYTLMGGNGSMIQWVEHEPTKANKDYTHFNHRGAKEAANLIFTQLNQGYEMYKELRKKRKKAAVPVKKDSVITNKDSVYED